MIEGVDTEFKELDRMKKSAKKVEEAPKAEEPAEKKEVKKIMQIRSETRNMFLKTKYPQAMTKVKRGHEEALALSPILYTKPFPSTRCFAIT